MMNNPMMNNPMGNPVFAMINMMRNGGNPMSFIQNMAGQNPQAAQFMRMVGGKNASQLKQMAESIAANNGTTVDEVARRLGLM